ncbi:MAG: hypothetical protein PHD88_04460 [Firmicutes bacterium]|nr:hypothetical protein [Bacillota bacterium]MDD4264168.1 hypothetical protein [Bacillota bacterium]MDD4693644.1 hypothetical protein [Bacillota bacterium]
MNIPSYTSEAGVGNLRRKDPPQENGSNAATLFLILILLVIMTMGNGLF